jgi:hypothetical protein
MIVPGGADVVMRPVLALELRIEEPYVLMASRPFGNWARRKMRTCEFLFHDQRSCSDGGAYTIENSRFAII